MIISTKIFHLIALPCAMDVVAVVVTVGGEGGRGFEVRVLKQPMLEAFSLAVKGYQIFLFFRGAHLDDRMKFRSPDRLFHRISE